MSARRLLALAACLLALSCLIAVAPTAARAGTATIGFLGSNAGELEAFREGLKEAGREVGPALLIEARFAEGRTERFRRLAHELAERGGATVLVAVGSAAAIAAKSYFPDTPVVFAAAIDPVGSGLVKSLAQPGGSMTGITTSAPDLLVRQLELLKEAVPTVTRVALVWNPAVSSKAVEVERARAAAPGLGLTLFSIPVRRPPDFARVPQALVTGRADAIVALDPIVAYHAGVLAEPAAARRLPVVYQELQGADEGGLLAYGPPIASQIRRTAVLVDRILGGATPASLPVEPPPVLELVVNLRAARALDITVPPSLRRRADRLIRP